jgi:hypothetical protein
MLQRGGYEIKVLNTIDFKKSMHYNPFTYIRSEKDILKFVTALISNTKGEGKSGDDFWVKAETLLYCALVGAIHFEAPESQQNMNTLVELINSMETKEDDENFKNAVDYYFEELELGNEEEGLQPKPDCFAVRQYKKYKLAAGVICSNGLLNRSPLFNAVRTLAAQADGHCEYGLQPGKEYPMTIEYIEVGDYLLPNIVLSERKGEHAPIGRYGKMRRAFLKEHRPIEYSRLLLTEQLFPYLRAVDEIADERKKYGCPERVIIREIVCEL